MSEVGDPFARAQVSAFSTSEKVRRALWMLAGVPLMRLTFHSWYGVRASILRAFGARVGRSCKVRRTAHIEIPWLLSMDDFATLGHASIVYNLGRITLGKRVEQVNGVAGHPEAARHDNRAIRDERSRLLCRDLWYGFHQRASSIMVASPWPTPTHRVARP